MTSILRSFETYISKYVTFTDTQYSFVLGLWTVGTFLWPDLDVFPYVVITSDTKRSGKTRTSELLSFACHNPHNFAGVTPAALFRVIKNGEPTIFIDEAEELSGEAASMMRTLNNVGYRKGQTIPRVRAGAEGEVEEWPAYCPKVFILIGDVNDTLRDRSIVIRMKRAEAPERFTYDAVKTAGSTIREHIRAMLLDDDKALRNEIVAAYQAHKGLSFLSDRDEEIWLPLFAVCQLLAPERLDELKRIAVDMATEKTATVRRYVNLAGAEKEAEDDEYARRLLHDMDEVTKGKKSIFTKDVIAALHALTTGPWRKFRGSGLDDRDLPNMLSRFGVAPKLVRQGDKVSRGYNRADIARALKAL